MGRTLWCSGVGRFHTGVYRWARGQPRETSTCEVLLRADTSQRVRGRGQTRNGGSRRARRSPSALRVGECRAIHSIISNDALMDRGSRSSAAHRRALKLVPDVPAAAAVPLSHGLLVLVLQRADQSVCIYFVRYTLILVWRADDGRWRRMVCCHHYPARYALYRTRAPFRYVSFSVHSQPAMLILSWNEAAHLYRIRSEQNPASSQSARRRGGRVGAAGLRDEMLSAGQAPKAFAWARKLARTAFRFRVLGWSSRESTWAAARDGGRSVDSGETARRHLCI